ncbi:DUF6194 family protein [Rhodococcus sp. NPDC058521]|uniref:DUF6194 family protein n=1 Tax=Rhodococcus sp. NPDC058521 TaxID=3346536 RepID=UPI00364ACB47
MSIDEIIDFVTDFGDVLVLRPEAGDGTPEIAWGDTFFYFSPDGTVPPGQPFATVVTKNYPDDDRCGLDSPGAFRVNVAADKDEFARFIGRTPREPATVPPFTGTDTVVAHPLYGSAGWLAVVNPGPATEFAVRELLESAYHRARARHERRA